MSSIKVSTIKRLFAVSGNECAYIDCPLPLVETSGTVTGEIAHIRASSKNGPRYDVVQTEDERNSFGNLVLLCSRHHTIIDSEIDCHPVELLQKIKREHEQQGSIEITPFTAAVSKTLLGNYQNITVTNNSGQVAIHSPGAVQASTVNIKNTKQKVVIAPPEGAISSVIEMNSYIEYLIGKYKDFQKLDTSKEGRYKYMALYSAVKRGYGSKWQLVPTVKFDSLVSFIHKKIDNTKVGRIRKNREQKSYHNYKEHLDSYFS